MYEGVAILELANRATELSEQQPASAQRRFFDFVLSNSSRGNGELRVEFRQPFDLIAGGMTELKQKRSAGVGSDDLYQFKYTSEVFHSSQKTRQKSSDVASGDLSRVQQRDQQHELFEHWAKLSKDQQQSVFELVRMLASKNSGVSLERCGSSCIH